MTDNITEFSDWLIRRGREASVKQRTRMVRRWLDDPDELWSKMTDKRAAPNYRRSIIASVRAWAKFTEDGKLLKQLEEIKQPAAAPKSTREPFARDEWEIIREAIAEADYLSPASKAVCGLVALRGFRCGDVLRLTRVNVKQAIKTGTLRYEGKGERWQDFTAAPFMGLLEDVAAFPWPKDYKGDETVWRVRHFICASGDQDSASRMIRREFDRIAIELEIDPKEVYSHRFRHTYATYFLQEMAGDPEAIFKLQTQMNWARLETAGNYVRRSRRAELDEVESRLLKR